MSGNGPTDCAGLARRAAIGAALLALPLWALLYANAAALRSDWDLANLGTSRRYWDDLAVAVVNYQQGVGRLSAGETVGWRCGEVIAWLRQSLPIAAHDAAVRGWQFWRTLPVHQFRHASPMRLRDSDDAGRSWFATWGFFILGGIAPYLPLWLAVLLALPLFYWIMLEHLVAGNGPTGAVFLLLLALSAYTADLLTLPYSAVGFFLVSLLLVVALATYSLTAPRITPSGLLLRWLVGGIVFAVCVLCRRSCLTLAPALTVAAAIGAIRASRGKKRPMGRAALFTVGALMLLLGPHLLVRPSAHHEEWVGIWEGLGDFDREKGHAWDDDVAREALRREGYVVSGSVGPWWNAEMESIFRRLTLRDIATDPAWYAGILGRRLAATVLQLRLWPRQSVDGRSFASHTRPNEGCIDVYYRLTHTADWFGLGRRLVELPLVVLWMPLVTAAALGAIALLRRRSGRLVLAKGQLGIVGLVALAAAPLPILVTTASGPETQAFTLVHLLLAGVLVEAVVRAVSRAVDRRSAPA